MAGNRDREELQILFNDEDIIVFVKPAGVASQGTREGDYDCVKRIKNYLAEKAGVRKEPDVYVINRLDQPVRGILVYAKNKEAAGFLSEDLKDGRFKKQYLLVATGVPEDVEPDGKDIAYTSYVKEGAVRRLTTEVAPGSEGAKKAELVYRVLEKKEDKALIEVDLLTGRHHQIRAQMASIFHGIWGDTKYNPDFRGKKGWFDIALTAYRLSFPHPTTGETISFAVVAEGEGYEPFRR